MKVLISGTSRGIGRAVAIRFLSLGHQVYGLDLLPSSIEDKNYVHSVCDASKKESLPKIEDIELAFINHGTQLGEEDIDNNLRGSINIAETYVKNRSIKAVLFNASASARTGDEFPYYVASKAGVVGYMKNLAMELAEKYKATCNAISFGGVITESTSKLVEDKELFNKIMEVTPLKKWAEEDEICDWVTFLLLQNKSMSGQDILIDNGETNLNRKFVWKD